MAMAYSAIRAVRVAYFPAKREQRRDIVRELVAWLTRYNVTAPSAG